MNAAEANSMAWAEGLAAMEASIGGAVVCMAAIAVVLFVGCLWIIRRVTRDIR